MATLKTKRVRVRRTPDFEDRIKTQLRKHRRMLAARSASIRGQIALQTNELAHTEPQLVELALGLANGEMGNVPALLGRKVRSGESFDEEIAIFRRRLDGIVDNPRPKSDRDGSGIWVVDGWLEASCEAGHMVMLPWFSVTQGEEMRLSWVCVPESLSPVLAYVFLLFLDITKPYGENLCRCQIEECGKLFLAQRRPSGRPRTKYCSDEHMQQAHAAESARRVRESREKRRKKRAKR